MAPQVIYESDPPETRGKRGPLMETAFAAAEAMFERHPELDCVVVTTITNDDPDMPHQNAVCWRKEIGVGPDADKRTNDAVVDAMRALLKLSKQIEAQGLWPKRQG